MEARVKKLRQYLTENHMDACLITKPENIYYLSAFTSGSDARLIISADDKYIITDGRYLQQAQQECADWQLVREYGSRLDSLAAICNKYNSLAVESHHLTYELFEQLMAQLKTQLYPQSNVIEKLRMVKDAAELDLLRQAARIGDMVFTNICSEIRVGISEKQVADRIACLLRELGCSREAFATIAVAGENAALPHGQPSDRLLKSGDMFTMDFGGFYKGYAGDMTRTVVLGEASDRLRDVYHQVWEAQELGVASIRAGASCRGVDQQVRRSLHKYGLDDYFLHGTGHGVGLEIHEMPGLSTHSEEILQEDMVVTVEPGVYIPGWGGIRIEDTVIVKNGGCEVISGSDKSLLIL